MSQIPVVGERVDYTLSESEAAQLAEKFAAEIGRTLNKPQADEAYPAVVVRVWNATCVNLQVQLDGAQLYWATSRTEGDRPGCWSRSATTPAAAEPGSEG